MGSNTVPWKRASCGRRIILIYLSGTRLVPLGACEPAALHRRRTPDPSSSHYSPAIPRCHVPALRRGLPRARKLARAGVARGSQRRTGLEGASPVPFSSRQRPRPLTRLVRLPPWFSRPRCFQFHSRAPGGVVAMVCYIHFLDTSCAAAGAPRPRTRTRYTEGRQDRILAPSSTRIRTRTVSPRLLRACTPWPMGRLRNAEPRGCETRLHPCSDSSFICSPYFSLDSMVSRSAASRPRWPWPWRGAAAAGTAPRRGWAAPGSPRPSSAARSGTRRGRSCSSSARAAAGAP